MKIKNSNWFSSKENDEEHQIHSQNDNIEIMINDKADEVTEKLFELFLLRLETSMRGSDFIFASVHLLYHKYHIMSFKQSGSFKWQQRDSNQQPLSW